LAATVLALGSREASSVLRGTSSRSEGRKGGEGMQKQLENLESALDGNTSFFAVSIQLQQSGGQCRRNAGGLC